MTSPGWKTGHRGGGCARCGAEFTPGRIVVSCLYEVPEDDDVPFARRDQCAACFDGDAVASGASEDGGETLDGDAAGVVVPGELRPPFSWWRSEVPQPEDKKAAFDLSVAREFLVRLLGQDDPERASLRYLLTLLLMRKRIVRVVEQFTDERGEIMSVRIPPDETVHEVLCPEIDEAETLSLRDQISNLFDLGDAEA